MFVHILDYTHGKASLWSDCPASDAIKRFYHLASQCFGIRKSLGNITLLSTKTENIPFPWCRWSNAHEMLQHSGGDIIVWDKDGEKIKSEFDL